MFLVYIDVANKVITKIGFSMVYEHIIMMAEVILMSRT